MDHLLALVCMFGFTRVVGCDDKRRARYFLFFAILESALFPEMASHRRFADRNLRFFFRRRAPCTPVGAAMGLAPFYDSRNCVVCLSPSVVPAQRGKMKGMTGQ